PRKEHGTPTNLLLRRQLQFCHGRQRYQQQQHITKNIQRGGRKNEKVDVVFALRSEHGLAEKEGQEERGCVQDERVKDADIDQILGEAVWGKEAVVEQQQGKLCEEEGWAPEDGYGFAFLTSSKSVCRVGG
ncbi:MAG: hypothetical protein Q9183_000498, partial [Haloplaca sp. 2 TL-2023]